MSNACMLHELIAWVAYALCSVAMYGQYHCKRGGVLEHKLLSLA